MQHRKTKLFAGHGLITEWKYVKRLYFADEDVSTMRPLSLPFPRSHVLRV